MWESGAQPGDFLRICDICGKRCKASETRKTWDGLIVCREDWDPKQPTLSIRATYDRQSVPEPRPEPPPVFVGPQYGFGSFTIISPNGTRYVVTVDDDGAVLVVRDTIGIPVYYFLLGNFKFTVTDEGALIPELIPTLFGSAIFGVSVFGGYPDPRFWGKGPLSWLMASPNNIYYSFTTAADAAWIPTLVQQYGVW